MAREENRSRVTALRNSVSVGLARLACVLRESVIRSRMVHGTEEVWRGEADELRCEVEEGKKEGNTDRWGRWSMRAETEISMVVDQRIGKEADCRIGKEVD